MKNCILGMIGAVVILYFILCAASIFCITSKRNELEKSVSSVVENTLLHFYGADDVKEDEVVLYATRLLQEKIPGNENVQVRLKGMDMELGILSLEVSESYRLPNGFYKECEMEKTAMVELEE